MNISVQGNSIQYRGKQTYRNLSRLYSNQHNRELALFYDDMYREAKARVHNIRFMKNEREYADAIDKFEKEEALGKSFTAELKAFGRVLCSKTGMLKEKLLYAYYNKI